MEYKNVFISCGELSGEIHASNLVKSIQKNNKRIKFYAIGSNLLKQNNCEIIIDYHEISIMGFIEIIKRYPALRRRLNLIKKFIRSHKLDLIILVDFPGFNFIIAKYAKQLNIKVVYYIPPQIWAWHYNRINKIKKYVDLVIPILPFEQEIYKKEQVPNLYLGHPLRDNIKVTRNRTSFCKKYQIPANRKIVSLLPGSRSQEIKHHIMILLDTALVLEEKFPKLFFVINIADSVDPQMIKDYLKKIPLRNIRIVKNENYNLFNSSYSAICVSGTVTLETAFFNVPMVVIYRVDQLFFLLAKYLFIRVPFVSLVNLIAGKSVVKEILQKDLTVDNLVDEMSRILSDNKYRTDMKKQLKQVKNALGKSGVIKKIAEKINSQFLVRSS